MIHFRNGYIVIVITLVFNKNHSYTYEQKNILVNHLEQLQMRVSHQGNVAENDLNNMTKKKNNVKNILSNVVNHKESIIIG